jgi:beta-galactosidase
LKLYKTGDTTSSLLFFFKMKIMMTSFKLFIRIRIFLTLLFLAGSISFSLSQVKTQEHSPRERISINNNWKFMRYDTNPDNLVYDIRPPITDRNDDKAADSKPTEAVNISVSEQVLKNWILPTANAFINDPAKHYERPGGNPGGDFPFVQGSFDDANWQQVDIPHDWAIKGPFYDGPNPAVGGGMGRLPSHGAGWYRKKLNITQADKGKTIYLDIDGAMSYAIVWLNGKLLGGWPYGYNSFRLNLTPYLNYGGDNQLAIRIDNPNHSARWYPGGGIYRNVWLEKVNPVHVAHWGTFVRTPKVSAASATIELDVELENASSSIQKVEIVTTIFALNGKFERTGKPLAVIPKSHSEIKAGEKLKITTSVTIAKPLLWGPPPNQKPHLHLAVTQLKVNGKTVDEYETEFGIRSLQFDAVKGLFVNGLPVRFLGVNQHHDLGALGAAFSKRAAERQLEILKELGCNAIRMAHNPPAPELLQLTDRMGFLVMDEIFDSWERKKTPHDFHLIFPDWHEADTRSFIRRDRNHPSVIAWSYGNEVGEQYTADTGAAISMKLYNIVKEEDDTRPATASMNYAKPGMPFPATMDILSLNYQGEGIRDAPAYAHLKGIRTSPLYPAFHQKFPDKMIISSETSSALSSRGSYIFPVTAGNSAPVSDSTGGDPINQDVSAYELYTAQFGSSPDKVFATQDKHPFVAGEFVWSGWDYLGEPTPYYTARSSYSGIIDLAGFKKDRFYLYQARWRPDLPMAHLLPHWTWPGREGKITPVHVFTSGDEAELFLNGQSLGRKKKGAFEYRIRWDSVVYTPGEIKVIAYKNGQKWAEEKSITTGEAVSLKATADRNQLNSDDDLSFITVEVLDTHGNAIPVASNMIEFRVEGEGEIVATDNGDPADLTAFSATRRAAYNGLALAIVKAKKGSTGTINVYISSPGIRSAKIELFRK